MRGRLPTLRLKLALVWTEIHRDELLETWKRAQNNQELLSIDPLHLGGDWMLPTVVQVYPVGNVLIIQFDDGKIIQWDAQPLRESGGVFARLRDDRVFFGELTVLNGTVAWSNDFDPHHCLDLDPLRLYEGGQDITLS
ncbi:MAG: DUF4160 domain-containing protein [Firmicutes bacterium]|nr:DUF4160 domain-containing protein [Bacillota bacterium]